MNVTFAYRISPGKLSGFGGELEGSAAVMSLIVAASVTVAVLEVEPEVEAKSAPV